MLILQLRNEEVIQVQLATGVTFYGGVVMEGNERFFEGLVSEETWRDVKPVLIENNFWHEIRTVDSI
jgi:hypothetical protein